jgi:hypothetical protein
MNNVRALSERIQAGFNQPETIEKLITLKTAEGQEITISSREAERLYYWLYEYRPTFLAFYDRGWRLAKTYWQGAGRPDSYPSQLDLFNAHAAHIRVDPYIDGITPPDTATDQAINGFFAYIRYMQDLEETERQEQEEADDPLPD